MSRRLDSLVAVTEDQLNEIIPTVSEIIPTPDSSQTKSRFLFMENTGDSLGNLDAVGIENFQLMLIANDLLRDGSHLALDIMRPSFDSASLGSVEIFKLSNTPLGESLRVNSTVNRYTAQSKRRSVFPRDIIFQGQVNGRESIVLSNTLSEKNFTNYAFAIALARDLGVPVYRIPLNFEGGNLIVSEYFVLTLADFARNNNLLPQNETGTIPTEQIPVNLGKPTQILDHKLLREKEQRVFHLDLLLNSLKDRDGNEFFLLASLQKAKDILVKKGLLTQPSEKFNFGRWLSRAGYEQFTQKAVEKFTTQVLTDFFKQAGSGHRPAEVAQAIEKMKTVLGFPAIAFKDVGINAFQFFLSANEQPLTEYIEIIRQSLIQLGIPSERIIDVPSLLFHGGFSEFSLSERQIKILSQRQVPIVAPVNGIQLSRQNGENPIFISGGGIKPFDEYLKSVLLSFGVDLLTLPSVLGLGYSEGAFRCSTVAWK